MAGHRASEAHAVFGRFDFASVDTVDGEQLAPLAEGSAALLPMDSYHYDDCVRIERGLRPRKGAPETFDALGLLHMLDRLKRMQAELDNARKRAAKEQQDFRDYALVDSIKTIIPVLDSFDRALASSPEKSEFHAGVELIQKQLVDALHKLGVRQISAKGEHFDPRYH